VGTPDPQDGQPPVLRLTAEEVAEARPPPPSPVRTPPVPERSPKVSLDRLAVGSLVLGLLGIPLVGVLLGPIAAVCGALALARLRGEEGRGSSLAAAGLALGVLDFIGWGIAIALLLGRPSEPAHREAMVPILAGQPALGVADAPPHIRRALVANVRVVCEGAGGGEGSGIVIGQSTDGAWVVTNRHVVECAAKDGDTGLRLSGGEGMERPGTVLWIAPAGIDLAVVQSGPLAGVEPVAVRRLHARVGDPVFVVGNPLGLARTLTVGTVSALRSVDAEGRSVHLVQVQAAVNPGNSGGGLYSSTGELLGVVSWMGEKRIGEGIAFAIAVDDLLDLLEEGGMTRRMRGGAGGPPGGDRP